MNIYMLLFISIHFYLTRVIPLVSSESSDLTFGLFQIFPDQKSNFWSSNFVIRQSLAMSHLHFVSALQRLAALPLLPTCRGSRKTSACHPSHLASFCIPADARILLLSTRLCDLCVIGNHCNRSPLVGGLLVSTRAGACDHPRSFWIQP